MPISLSEDEMSAIMTAAQPLHPSRRAAFLADVAEALQAGGEIGPGSVGRAIRTAQRAHFDPPADTGIRAPRAGAPRVRRTG